MQHAHSTHAASAQHTRDTHASSIHLAYMRHTCGHACGHESVVRDGAGMQHYLPRSTSQLLNIRPHLSRHRLFLLGHCMNACTKWQRTVAATAARRRRTLGGPSVDADLFPWRRRVEGATRCTKIRSALNEHRSDGAMAALYRSVSASPTACPMHGCTPVRVEPSRRAARNQTHVYTHV